MAKRQKPALIRGNICDEHGNILGQKTFRLDQIRAFTEKRSVLTEDFRQRAAELYPRVCTMVGCSKHAFVEGFAYDAHPESELAIWNRMAKTVDMLDTGVITTPPMPRMLIEGIVLGVVNCAVDVAGACGVPDEYVHLVKLVYAKFKQLDEGTKGE